MIFLRVEAAIKISWIAKWQRERIWILSTTVLQCTSCDIARKEKKQKGKNSSVLVLHCQWKGWTIFFYCIICKIYAFSTVQIQFLFSSFTREEKKSSGNLGTLSIPKHGWSFAFLGPHHYPLQLSLPLCQITFSFNIPDSIVHFSLFVSLSIFPPAFSFSFSYFLNDWDINSCLLILFFLFSEGKHENFLTQKLLLGFLWSEKSISDLGFCLLLVLSLQSVGSLLFLAHTGCDFLFPYAWHLNF